MAGEIATAWLSVMPSMSGFGKEAVRQIGPQARQVGAVAGQQAGDAFSQTAAKGSSNWLKDTAQGAIKNVALYGSMYKIIQGVSVGINAMFDSMIGFNGQLEQASIGFETLLGSSAAAKDQMQWINDFAKATPFRYGDLVGYSQSLIAMGFSAEQARTTLEATGNAAAALGRGSESIQRINLALGQMWTKGKVQSQEMLQLTEAGIGGWQMLAKAYGTTVEDIQAQVTAGNVKAADAVPALVAGMNAQFGGLMDKQSKTYLGIVSNIQDTLQQKLAKAGEPLFNELTVDAQKLLDALDDPEVVKTLDGIGNALADGAKFLVSATEFAIKYRDVLLTVAVAYTAMSVAQNLAAKSAAASSTGGLTGNLLGGAFGMRSAASAAAIAAQGKLVAADQALLAAQTNVTNSMARQEAATLELAAANAETTVSTQRLVLAKAEQRAADAALVSSGPKVVAAETAQAEAALAAAAAEEKLAGARMAALKTGSLSLLKTAGPIIGLLGMVDAYGRVGDAARDGENATLGFAESAGSGAIAGAALGSVIPGLGTAAGAAIGSVLGLASGVWSYQTALNAANKDTSLAQQALQNYGVEANLAALALAGVTNAQLDAAGGTQALVEAMKSGTLDDYLTKLKSQNDALRVQADAARAVWGEADKINWNDANLTDEQKAQMESAQALILSSEQLDRAYQSLTGNGDALAAATSQITSANYQAAFASDMQTGALGSMTKAAWDAIQAQGGLGNEAITAALRMEGLAGTAGYVTQMITGIPTGTQINFSTNAMDVAQQIAVLMATQDALYAEMGKPGADNLGGRTNSLSSRINALKGQLASALTTPSTTLSLPTSGSAAKGGGGGGSSAASKAAQAAAQSAAEAARKLEQDRKAQVAFGDAFGSLMESALEGNFEDYRKKLQDEITSLTRDGYTSAASTLTRMSAALTTAALDYSVLTNKLKAATTAYDDLTGKMQDQFNTSRDLINSLGKATDAQSFDQLAYLLGETTSKALDYQTVLQQLKDQGLSDNLWNQLAQAGPESAGLAQSILDQGAAGIDQLNSLSGGLVDAADSMGKLVSDSMYQNGVDAMSQYIEGLKSGSSALEAQLQTIANNVLNQTAGAITPGNAGYSQISTAPQQVTNQYTVSVSASSLGDLKSVQDFLAMLEQAPTTQLVNQAGTVTS